MVYTLTLNPSLDYNVNVSNFRFGTTNRTTKESICVGGKGINVSIMLKNLGLDSKALGFLAGFTGVEIRRNLCDLGLQTDFIDVSQGNSRINVKVRAEEETEINGMGPLLQTQDIEALYGKLGQVKDGDILVLAGSIPSGLPESLYMDIMIHLAKKDLKIVVDATRNSLLNTLPYHPFLIKPNLQELEEIFGVKITNKQEVFEYAKELQNKGATNVIVSMAGDGAIFVGEDGSCYESEAPKGKVVNSVGAGDSMIAGFLNGYINTKNYKKAFEMGVCAGSASAFSEQLATKEEVEKIIKYKVTIFKI